MISDAPNFWSAALPVRYLFFNIRYTAGCQFRILPLDTYWASKITGYLNMMLDTYSASKITGYLNMLLDTYSASKITGYLNMLLDT